MDVADLVSPVMVARALGLSIYMLAAVASSAPLAGSERGADCGEWFYYYNDECQPLVVDETEIRITTPEGTASPEEVFDALSWAGESRFTLQYAVKWLFHLPNASEAPADLWLFRRPPSGGTGVRELISRLVTRPGNAWFWAPAFESSSSSYPSFSLDQRVSVRFLPSTPISVVAAVIEQEIPGSSFTGAGHFPDHYYVVTPHLDGFEILLAANRLALRSEVASAGPNLVGAGGPSGGPAPVPVPVLSSSGLLLLAAALALIASTLLRRRSTAGQAVR